MYINICIFSLVMSSFAVCLNKHIHTYLRIRGYICMYLYSYILYVCMGVWLSVCVWGGMWCVLWVFGCVCVCLCVCICVSMYIRMYVYTYVCMYVCINKLVIAGSAAALAGDKLLCRLLELLCVCVCVCVCVYVCIHLSLSRPLHFSPLLIFPPSLPPSRTLPTPSHAINPFWSQVRGRDTLVRLPLSAEGDSFPAWANAIANTVSAGGGG
jgi:hypothetical protein